MPPCARLRPPLQELQSVQKGKRLKGFEAIRGVHLTDEPFRWGILKCVKKG